MSLQEAITALLSLLFAIGGWFLRELYQSVKELQRDQRAIEHDLHANYIPRNEVRKLFEDIMDAIKELRDELKSKADK